jgi:hypothetical protein
MYLIQMGYDPRRNRRRRRRGSYPIWIKYMAWCIGLAILVSLAQIAYFAVRSDPRDAKVFAERQLRFSTLAPNEKVLASVSVFQRPAVDYFRATRGLLVLTDAPGDSARPVGGRLIYLGLQPRDPLSPPDAPPTFDERAWRVDTLAHVTPKRTFFMLSRGLRIRTPTGTINVGVPSPASKDADALLKQLNQKYAQLRAVGWQRREERRARDRERMLAVNAGRREWFHTVRRGEAVASVARMFNTTPEQIRALNGLPNDKIRIGQVLKVKGWTKQPVPFPSGIQPELTPPAAPATPVGAPTPVRR